VIAFGFPPDSPDVCIPVDASGVIQLAALAAWCVYEIGRLRGEISVVSDRLGGRRLVEQAKQRLQEDQGLGEPAAYAYMRKLSRQRRIRMAEIARELLSSSGLAPIDAPP
jgi:response regulator NasT